MSVPRFRTLLLLVLLVAGALNVHALVLNLRGYARLRDTSFEAVRGRVHGIRAAMGQRIALGGGFDRAAALRFAAGEGEWEAVEAFTVEGRPLDGLPAPPGPSHWLSAGDLEALRAGAVLVGADPARRGERILAYMLFGAPDDTAVLRFVAASPELAEDLDDRRQLFVGHAATLVILFLAGGYLMAPRPSEAEAAPPGALVAYEEAMERLRDHGEEQTERHEAERRQMEEVLRDKEALARAGELTAGIVHEVRNGLGTIVGYARLIENAPQAPAGSARSIREECETLEAVIRRFMDFVRRETLALGPVDLGGLLRRVAARESRRAGPPVAVDGAGAGVITADEALLETALENLVRNAREAAGPSGHVWVHAERQGVHALVTIADDGAGFSPSVRAALRPFFTTKAGGLGLGLAITLKIVKLHGGSLVFGERQPRGAAVSMKLPAEGPPRGPGVTDGSVQTDGVGV